MSASIILLVLSLVGGVMAANQITTVNDTASLAAMDKVCSGAPISNLNMCNNTCLSCTSSDSFKCSACNTAFVLSTAACLLDNSIHTYTIYNYLNAQSASLMTSDLAKFIYGDTKTSIGPNKVIEVCKDNTYELFMAGPFKDTNIIGIDYKLTDNIDRIQIKFNFMAFIQDITLWVDINENNIFKKQFTIFSDLIGTYGKLPNNAGPNYFYINALTSSNVGSVISPVDTGMQTLISNEISIRMYITTGDQGYNWAFNDFVVIQRACETCVTVAVQNLLDKLTRMCYIVLIVVVVLLIMLFVMIKLESLKRKWDFEDKLGSSDSLPVKAIDRIIDSLERTCKTMDKEMKNQNKHF
jgi:hypothetical protein